MKDTDFEAPGIEELRPHLPAYEIEGFIAQGGMGVVYAARQTSLDRPVAIKILPRQLSKDPEFRRNFAAEAKAMARLNHPNLIGVYDFGEADGMFYIVMERVEGKSLHHSANGESIEQSEAARIVSGICQGLAHAHQHGVLHRDIKPSNILLDANGQPKIGDFGLARPVESAQATEGEYIWGTPGYSAPEVVDHPDSVDQRTDVFAVGVLLYELLTARLPGEPWQAPSQLVNCHQQFDTIIRRATHPSPGMRFAGADAMAKEVDALRARLGQTGGANGQSPRTRLKQGNAPVRRKTPAKNAPQSSSKAVPFFITLGVVAGLAVIFAAIKTGDRPEPAGGNEAPPTTSTSPSSSESREAPTPLAEASPVAAQSAMPVDEDTKPVAVVSEPAPAEPIPSPPEPPAPPPEPLMEALARLAEPLRKGDFSEVPEGMVQKGNFRFLLVDEPHTWYSALEVAETVGAQLAVLDSPAALTWASEYYANRTPVWLGLSDSGTESNWHWVSGSPVNLSLWAPGQPGSAAGAADVEDFAALLPGNALLDDLEGERSLPFLLQWIEGAETTGLLANQLARIGEQFRARQAPVFPAGTHNVSGSRFLVMPRKLTWEEASAMATMAGGHLAVPSNAEEQAWISSRLKNFLDPSSACWMGGIKMGDAWNFVTKEAFYFVNWAEGQPDASDSSQTYLQIRHADGAPIAYRAAGANSEETGSFLLEWSAPSRRNMPGSNGNLPALEWLTSYRARILRQEGDKIENYRKESQKVVDDFADEIEKQSDFARQLGNEASDYIDGFVESIRKGGTVPTQFDNEIARRFFGESLEEALKEQERVETEFKSEIETARSTYLSGLETEEGRRSTMGDKDGAGLLSREKAAASDDTYFRDILEGKSPATPGAPSETQEKPGMQEQISPPARPSNGKSIFNTD